jgi:acyl carrier protein
MDKAETQNLVARLLHELFDIPLEKITPTATLFDDLDIDSIDAVDLAVEFKKQTGRQLAPEEFKRIRTVGDIVDAFHAQPGEA